ncbi:histone-lysine N-methyltransferase trithorax [Lutzomyia longipalpis]|uniref:histone-lysine N-methyltransferase trithorax n=1 Tax=Lutzomyia longipalpis TaxID=7200 RepID=UPI0024840C53|nr:histone-lysine N-methyltransferase trithorax [Lutzomyia longipalpis]XP_055679086.1 histone-lysine N-methyltransferase trithorax [Lutzomyia longipalpis]
MGRSKFPGKPSKLVNKKRISVLGGSAKCGNCDTSADDDTDNQQYSPNDDNSQWNSSSSRHESSEPLLLHASNTNAPSSPTQTTPSCSFHEDGDNIQAVPSHEVIIPQGSDTARGNANGEEKTSTEDAVKDRVGMQKSDATSESRPKDKPGGEKTSKKKTVTFKNVLETSDDVLVRKSYNPDFAPPLVPIIKKESLTRMENSIVRPSRLTEVMKQNSNNQDTMKALSFRLSSIPSNDDQGNAKDPPNGEGGDEEANGEGERRTEGGLARDKRFILPKRSLHSCRVIKPNKKFLDNMDDCSSKKRLQLSMKRKNQLDGVDKKKRMQKEITFQDTFINSTLSSKISNSKLDTENCGESETSQTQSENSDDADETDEEESKLINGDKSKRIEQQRLFCKSIFHSTSGKSAIPSTQNSGNSSGKVILRQPRLQFSTGTIISSSTSTNSAASTSNATTSTMMEKTFSFNVNSNSIKNSISSSHSVSLPSSSALSSMTSSTCGICGTISSCRYAQKCRKFGINSCEACRKFISKMIKKLAASSGNHCQSNPMQCSKGDGTCTLQPMPRGGHLKTLKMALKERCQACWLKRCIKSFQIPSGPKARLIATLPVTMRDVDTNIVGISTKFSIKRETENQSNMNIFSNPPNTDRMLDIEFKTTKTLPFSNPLVENNATFGSTPLVVPTITEKPMIMVHSPPHVRNTVETAAQVKGKGTPSEGDGSNTKSSAKTSNNSVINSNAGTNENTDEKTKVCRKKGDAPQVNGSKEAAINAPQTDASAPKRQRIDLKGPRVKHVCRSASIVLGQPIATFPNESPLENLDTPPRPDSPHADVVGMVETIVERPNSMCTDCGDTNTQVLGLSPPATPIDSPNDEADVPMVEKDSEMAGNEESVKENVMKTKASVDESQKPTTRKLSRPSYNVTNLSNRLTAISSTKRIQQLTIQNPMVSIDFWENYDPAEVSQTGFGLILSESVPLRAICFLCGSAGTDALIFCICCCEPYHSYCVEDEYNLKPTALDETGISILDMSSGSPNVRNRLNWLCPRCTVCYTCNMASGSKVKCQKCQKNYHSTCLGTSKRLLGADRPLICANCLKCKSCSTTNVTKFVGNLPMCTACFKLRQKGNFCPLCQKCYEDNDFDLKMMECGDCKRWVHAKCEGLTDEQYNMLSVLPESIEFICKKCAKNNSMADMWRDAVAAEFKSGLLSVVKMLSKSRPACALLKLSPRKKSNICACQPILSSRSIQFKKLTEGNVENTLSGEDANFEEASNLSEKTVDGEAENTQCYCGLKQKLAYATSSPSLLDLKRKINDNEYISLQEFNYDMLKIINSVSCDDLVTAYKEILSETFPWFQNETKACTDALEEDMYDSCDFTANPDTLSMDCDQMVPTVDIPENGEEYFYGSYERNDDRVCLFCRQTGEQMALQEGRLLYCGQNSWVHTNCALWSAEVFEEIDGSLQNVHSAVSRGRMIKCTECGNKGATVGCNVKNCGEHFHYPCARTAKCVFMSDKTVYCPRHEDETTKKKCHPEGDFDVHRPVYVELDRRRKKSVEPGKVQFAIGSLAVRNIGRFVPILSDLSDVIVPSDFLCTRLYWSTKEPWKIVEYTIRTSIQCTSSTHCMDLGKNFTVDHSSTTNLIQKGLNQIAKWHSSLSNGEDSGDHSRTKQNMDSVGGGDEQGEEEPQSNADLLPPEIKEAIFEDLPHDILDGISMLDIFPKLMTYEDLVAMDSKSEIYFGGELIKDAKEYVAEDEVTNQPMENWSHSSTVTHVEDPLLSSTRPMSTTMAKELKRSKSEVFNRGVGGSRNHQRSSSLTWNCKVDQNTKRRKVSMLQELRLPESVFRTFGRSDIKASTSGDRKITWSAKKLLQIENENTQDASAEKKIVEKLKISQLDGMDDLSSGSESGSPLPHYTIHNVPFDQNCGESPVKCDRCHCTYRTQDSFQRHLLTCEPMSTSESESEANPHTPDAEVATIAPNNMLTVTVSDICNSSTISTIQPHNLVQNFNGQILGNGNVNTIQAIPNQGANTITIPSSLQNIIPIQNGGQISLQNPQIQTVPLSGVNQLGQINGGMSNVLMTTPQNQQFTQPLSVNNFQQQVFPLQNINQYNDMNSNYLQKTQRILPQTSGIQPTIQLSGGINIQNFNNTPIIQPAASQPQIISIGGTSNNSQIMTLAPAPIRTSGTIMQTTPQKNQIILPQPADKMMKKQALPRIQSAAMMKTKGRQTNGKNQPIQMKKIVTKPNTNALQIVNSTNLPIIRPQQTIQTPTTTLATTTSNPGVVFQQPQPLIVQPMNNNANLVQYVTDSNGMQYIAMPSNEYKQPQTQFLAPSPIVPGAFQLQTDANGQLVLANAAPGLQVLPSGAMQLAQPQQPQVIGTLIQPQATTIQCGMMATEQMVLGSTPTLEMVTDPNSGCMYLTSQPVYYGLETIVQNTVMSSQQFVSTAMQGVLSQNSSFSATTTQVFQASKIEPIMEVPGGYVVLNNMPDQQQTQAAIMPTTQVLPQIQAQPQVTQQIRPVSPPKPTVKSAPIVVTKVQPQVINKVIPSQPANVVNIEQQPAPQAVKPQVQPVILPKTMTITSSSSTPIFHQASMPPPPQELQSSQMKTIIVTTPNTVQPIPRAANIIKPIAKGHVNSATIKPKIITKPVIGRTSVNRPKGGTFTIKQSPAISINQATKNDSIVGDVIITTVAQNNMQSQMVSSQQSNQQIFPVEKENVQNIIQLASASSDTTKTLQEGVVFSPVNRNQQNTHNFQTNSTPTPQIQLPSAPYAPSHNSNVPTNVVNPIQQCHYNGNTTNSRPTNRVLPMQTIQARQSPPTPPEPKCQVEEPVVPPKIEEIPAKEDVVMTELPSPQLVIEESPMEEEKKDEEEPQEEETEDFENRDLVEDENSREKDTSSPASLHLKTIFQNDVQADLFDQIKSMDDKDESSSESSTPEVKQKICEILVNLDKEDCNKNNVLLDSAMEDIIEHKENRNPVAAPQEDVNFKQPQPRTTFSIQRSLNALQPLKAPPGPRMLYEIQSEDGFHYKSTSITDIWDKVFEAVQIARKTHGLCALPDGPLADMSGHRMLGLKSNALRYLIEQLPGVETCKNYTPKYHERKLNKDTAPLFPHFIDFDDSKENIFGAARCEPYSGRSEYDMFSWLASRHRKQPAPVTIQLDSEITIPRRGSSSNLPMAMRYRTLKETSKDSVGVYRSHIHGRGLFCTRDIEAGEMVIEYAGELIRATLTDKREHYYESKGIGCYMFRIDDNFVVDATMRGNAARFINHSCEPNCYSKVVDILGHKHIIIFALRRIVPGEELTYDYKFPFEDVKIPCSCGSKRCRKYLN